MMIRRCVAVFALCCSITCVAQTAIDLSVPDEVSHRFMLEDLWSRFSISERINPFYLRADLDGDGKPDYIVLVNEKGTHQEYTALLLSSEAKVRLYPSKGRTSDGWTIVDQRYLTQRTRAILRATHREAFVIKFGGPGILEYWDGKELRSQPWGD